MIEKIKTAIENMDVIQAMSLIICLEVLTGIIMFVVTNILSEIIGDIGIGIIGVIILCIGKYIEHWELNSVNIRNTEDTLLLLKEKTV